jgi:hypothetical protein
MSRRTTDIPTSPQGYPLASSEESSTNNAARDPEQTIPDSTLFGHELRAVRAESSEDRGTAPQGRPDPAPGADGVEFATLENRVAQVETQNRRLKWGIVGILLMLGYLSYEKFAPADIIVRQTLMESEEVKLVDKSGQTRFFLRMYSRVPVLQLLDTSGKPRMSLGLRFDDTPFIDLSDRSGNTRATFEMTAQDQPTLKLFDEQGETTFTVK